MYWYEFGLYVLGVVVIGVGFISGKLYLEVRKLRELAKKQNRLLKKNLAELRDEYARLNRAVVNERKGKRGAAEATKKEKGEKGHRRKKKTIKRC